MVVNGEQQPDSRIAAAASSSGADEHGSMGASDSGGVLIEAGLAFWSSTDRTDDERVVYVEQRIYPLYKLMVDELFNTADLCAARFDELRTSHAWWRHLIIVFTGIVAILNSGAALVAARGPEGPGFDPGPWIPLLLAGTAAVAAVGLTMLANLENFGNHLERGQAYRDTRELYLDAARESNQLWEIYVVPFWGGPEACVNAAELYRRLCVKDRELRQKAKNLTQPRQRNG
jgi:hypothetical protein